MTSGERVRAAAPAPIRWAALLAVFAWGLYQAYWNLAAANFNADEPLYVDAGWRNWHGDLTPILEHPPTGKYIIGAAQVLLGEGALAGRIAASTAVVLGGLVLWLWLRREMGWMLALIPTAFWLLLPRATDGGGQRLDRFAILEPFMVFFAITAMWLGWSWFRTGRWWMFAGAGLMMALSITSKLSTFAILPAFLLLLVLRARGLPPGRRLRTVVIGAVSFGLAFVVTFVAVYLPVGLVHAIEYMVAFQGEHNDDGHVVTVAGVTSAHPPWWANLWFTASGMGIPATIVLGLGVVISIASAIRGRHRTLVGYLLCAFVFCLVFYMLVSRIALSHYYYVWAWLLCVLGGMGIARLLEPVLAATRRSIVVVGRSIAVVCLLVATLVSADLSIAISQERARGTALLVGELADARYDDGLVLVAGMAPWQYYPYIGDRYTTDPNSSGIVAIATMESARFPLPQEVIDYRERRHPGDETIHLDDVTLTVLGRSTDDKGIDGEISAESK